MSMTVDVATSGAVFERQDHTSYRHRVAFRTRSTGPSMLSQYRYSSRLRCSKDGGQVAHHFDAPGFQRGGALRRS
jgi:hypothetical protein